MTSPHCGLTTLLVASCFLLVAPSPARADEPEQQPATGAADEASQSLNVRLAKARLQLAKLELDRALAANQRTPVMYSTVMIELLRRNVGVAEVRLAALSRPGDADLHSVHLRELESALKISELEWKNAVRLRERLPNAIQASQVESLRLRAEVARLALARGRDPGHVATPMDHVHWQLEQMRQELLELTFRVEKLSTRD